MTAASRQDPLVSDVAKLSLGVGGLAMCLTLVFLGMRAVMDVGGACADGGPYVSAQGCPAGSTVALVLGMFGLFLFGGIAMWYGVRVGGIWSAAPLLAWSALFLSLGWNFLDYGVFNTPAGEGIVWGWAFCGVLFVLMGAVPLIVGLSVFGSAPLRRATVVVSGSGADAPTTLRMVPVATTTEAEGADAAPSARSVALAGISADMGAAVAQALHEPAAPEEPASPDRPHPAPPAAPGDQDFDEGTQALLDRLERLADLRDRGLLGADEYETAKETIVRELETRQ
jgi:hypothetical protein